MCIPPPGGETERRHGEHSELDYHSVRSDNRSDSQIDFHEYDEKQCQKVKLWGFQVSWRWIWFPDITVLASLLVLEYETCNGIS